MRKLILSALLSMVVLSANAADIPAVRACTENDDSYPWVLKDRPGLTILMLKQVERQIGGKIEVSPLPWKRCLDELKAGNIDAAFKISYSETRAAELGVYPMTGGKADASRRMLTDSYSLYRLKGSAVEWDGKTLKAAGPVGAQLGFSVVDQLKSLGARVDDGSRSADDSLKKLALGRIVALALQTEEGDASVAANPELRDKVEKINPVLVEKPYFLIFSKNFHSKNTEYAQAIWNAIAAVRESAEYKATVKSFK